LPFVIPVDQCPADGAEKHCPLIIMSKMETMVGRVMEPFTLAGDVQDSAVPALQNSKATHICHAKD
jgi:hypothetical protein